MVKKLGNNDFIINLLFILPPVYINMSKRIAHDIVQISKNIFIHLFFETVSFSSKNHDEHTKNIVLPKEPKC